MWEKALLLILALLIILVFASMLAIYIVYPFWSRQSVFHSYDTWRYFVTEPAMIQTKPMLKPIPKWYQPAHISLHSLTELADTSTYYEFLQCHLQPDERLLWGMPQEVWRDLFIGSTLPTYLSNKRSDTVFEGMMVAYAVDIRIRNSGRMALYCLDYFAIDHNITQNREQIGQELLYTHIVLQEKAAATVHSFLFSKRGTGIPGVVPLMQCKYVEVLTPALTKTPVQLKKPYLLQTANQTKDIDAIYERVEASFSMAAMPTKTQFENRLNNGSTYLATVQVDGYITAFYLCRRTFVVDSETGLQAVELIGSWRDVKQINRKDFLVGWLAALDRWRRELGGGSMKYINVDRVMIPLTGFNMDLAMNESHTELMFEPGRVVSETTQWWYLYNMYCKPLASNECFLFV